jgi:hypothetical protein
VFAALTALTKNRSEISKCIFFFGIIVLWFLRNLVILYKYGFKKCFNKTTSGVQIVFDKISSLRFAGEAVSKSTPTPEILKQDKIS